MEGAEKRVEREGISSSQMNYHFVNKAPHAPIVLESHTLLFELQLKI
jgi:hypothetical protein